MSNDAYCRPCFKPSPTRRRRYGRFATVQMRCKVVHLISTVKIAENRVYPIPTRSIIKPSPTRRRRYGRFATVQMRCKVVHLISTVKIAENRVYPIPTRSIIKPSPTRRRRYGRFATVQMRCIVPLRERTKPCLAPMGSSARTPVNAKNARTEDPRVSGIQISF